MQLPYVQQQILESITGIKLLFPDFEPQMLSVETAQSAQEWD